jgi:hypothetical protein
LTTAKSLLIATLLLAGCGDYEIPLTNGYFISRVSAGRFIVVDPNHRVVVPATVTEYAVEAHVVYGQISGETNGQIEYFVIDTLDGQTLTGLSREQWDMALAQRGVTAHRLKQPSRWDAR